MRRLSLSMVVCVSIGLLVGGAAGAAEPDVVRLLPRGDLGDGIVAAGAPEHFVGKKLFDYMNGGAELYLAYGFEDLGVAAYKAGAVELRLALYRMGGAADAYGIYAFAASGKQVELGGPNSLAPNMLSFFKGRYYVRVVAQKVSPEADRAMVALGKRVFAALPDKAVVPPAVAKLPSGEVSGSLRYLTNPETARTVWFDGEGGVLLTPGALAVTATYPGDEDDILLTRADYSKADGALAVCAALSKKLGLTAKTEGGKCTAAGKTPDDVFAAIDTVGPVLRWASGAPDATSAQGWLAKIKVR